MKIIKRISALLLIFLLTLAFVSCEGYGAIVRIEFSGDGKTASMRKIEYDLSAFSSKADQLDTQLGIIPTLINVNPSINYDKLLDAFNMSGAKFEKQTDPNARTYSLGDKTLVVYEAGFISFSDASLYGKTNTCDRDTAVGKVKTVANNAGINISDLYEDDVYEDEDGTITVSFKRKINGIDVAGRCGLTAVINGDGISSLSFTASSYSGEFEMEIIGVEKALELLLSENSSHSFGREIGQASTAIKKVTVTDVKLVYWDSAYTQTKMYQSHIQPVYCFSGICTDAEGNETEYTGYVRGISDDYTANFKVEEIE